MTFKLILLKCDISFNKMLLKLPSYQGVNWTDVGVSLHSCFMYEPQIADNCQVYNGNT